jgi:hypothetical protein
MVFTMGSQIHMAGGNLMDCGLKSVGNSSQKNGTFVKKIWRFLRGSGENGFGVFS